MVIRISSVKLSLSYWSDGTRMIGFYTCLFVTNLVMLISIRFSALDFGDTIKVNPKKMNNFAGIKISIPKNNNKHI